MEQLMNGNRGDMCVCVGNLKLIKIRTRDILRLFLESNSMWKEEKEKNIFIVLFLFIIINIKTRQFA